MYKAASDHQHRQTRTGSHSLTVKSTGKYDHLPVDLRREEEAYQSLKQQYDTSMAELRRIQEEKAAFKKRLTGEFDEQQRFLIRQVIRELKDKEHILTTSLGHLRKIVREGGEMVYCTLFYYIAKQVLSDGLMALIDQEARQIIDRPMHEITNNMSTQARKARRRQNEPGQSTIGSGQRDEKTI